MSDAALLPFLTVTNRLGERALRPLIPVNLSLNNQQQTATALLDTGADVNVLPYELGLALGAQWEQSRRGIRLSGNLSRYEARGLIVQCAIGQLAPVTLVFAWTQAEQVPLIFGQVNFFAEFDVCFRQATNQIEVRPK
jgi:hypothetical protein